MTFFGDYHTHTIYSHGKGTVEDNVRAALNAGLGQIAITDHGFGHLLYGVKARKFAQYRADIENARGLFPDIKVLAGIEANITGLNGQTDLNDEELEHLGLILLGYHQMVRAASCKDFFSFYVPVQLSGLIRHTPDKRRGRNTEALIKAIHKYPVDILVHPNHKMEVDFALLCREASRLGVYIELNGKKNPLKDDWIAEALAQTDVMFIADSDAHSPGRVGDLGLPLSIIKRLQIPASRIANADGKAPVFRSRINI